MPTNQRVQSAIVDLSEGLSAIGYETKDVIGPVNPNGEPIPEEEIEEIQEDVQYYLTAETSRSSFYIRFDLDSEYAIVVYPMSVLGHIGSYLNKDEVEALVGESIDWGETNDQEEDMITKRAAELVVENADKSQYHTAAFNLSVYASTSVVDYRQTTTDSGFPVEFQCLRAIFPYSENMTMERIDNRVHPVIIAGERGRRYVEYAFRINKDNKSPEEYEFESIF